MIVGHMYRNSKQTRKQYSKLSGTYLLGGRATHALCHVVYTSFHRVFFIIPTALSSLKLEACCYRDLLVCPEREGGETERELAKL